MISPPEADTIDLHRNTSMIHTSNRVLKVFQEERINMVGTYTEVRINELKNRVEQL